MEFDTEDSTNALIITYDGIRYIFMRDEDDSTSTELLTVFENILDDHHMNLIDRYLK